MSSSRCGAPWRRAVPCTLGGCPCVAASAELRGAHTPPPRHVVPIRFDMNLLFDPSALAMLEGEDAMEARANKLSLELSKVLEDFKVAEESVRAYKAKYLKATTANEYAANARVEAAVTATRREYEKELQDMEVRAAARWRPAVADCWHTGPAA